MGSFDGVSSKFMDRLKAGVEAGDELDICLNRERVEIKERDSTKGGREQNG